MRCYRAVGSSSCAYRFLLELNSREGVCDGALQRGAYSISRTCCLNFGVCTVAGWLVGWFWSLSTAFGKADPEKASKWDLRECK